MTIRTKMGPSFANALSVFQTSHMLPVGFFVSKRWPTMAPAFGQERFQGPSDWSSKEKLASDTVVKVNRIARLDFFLVFLDVFQKFGRRPVASIFGIVSVEIANAVGRIKVTVPAKVALDRLVGGAMLFGSHDGLIRHDRVLGLCRRAKELVKEKETTGCSRTRGFRKLLRDKGWSKGRSCRGDPKSHGQGRFGEFHR